MHTFQDYCSDLLKAIAQERFHNHGLMAERQNNVTKAFLVNISRNLKSCCLLLRDTGESVNAMVERAVKDLIEEGQVIQVKEGYPVYDLTDQYQWQLHNNNEQH